MRKYQIRKTILKALDEYSGSPCCAEDLVDYHGFALLKPSLDEIAAEWKQLEEFGYIEPCEGFGGEYCLISKDGLKQINPEFAKDAFIHGPREAKRS